MSSKKPSTKPVKSLLDYTKQRGSSQVAQKQPATIKEIREDELLAALEALLKSRRVLKRDELESWAKLRGYPLNAIMRVLIKLISDGKVVKRLNDNGELVYAWKEDQ